VPLQRPLFPLDHDRRRRTGIASGFRAYAAQENKPHGRMIEQIARPADQKLAIEADEMTGDIQYG
jgi:hypothetical protein